MYQSMNLNTFNETMQQPPIIESTIKCFDKEATNLFNKIIDNINYISKYIENLNESLINIDSQLKLITNNTVDKVEQPNKADLNIFFKNDIEKKSLERINTIQDDLKDIKEIAKNKNNCLIMTDIFDKIDKIEKLINIIIKKNEETDNLKIQQLNKSLHSSIPKLKRPPLLK